MFMYYTKAIKINNLTVMSWYSFELVGCLLVYTYLYCFTDLLYTKDKTHKCILPSIIIIYVLYNVLYNEICYTGQQKESDQYIPTYLIIYINDICMMKEFNIFAIFTNANANK